MSNSKIDARYSDINFRARMRDLLVQASSITNKKSLKIAKSFGFGHPKFIARKLDYWMSEGGDVQDVEILKAVELFIKTETPTLYSLLDKSRYAHAMAVGLSYLIGAKSRKISPEESQKIHEYDGIYELCRSVPGDQAINPIPEDRTLIFSSIKGHEYLTIHIVDYVPCVNSDEGYDLYLWLAGVGVPRADHIFAVLSDAIDKTILIQMKIYMDISRQSVKLKFASTENIEEYRYKWHTNSEAEYFLDQIKSGFEPDDYIFEIANNIRWSV